MGWLVPPAEVTGSWRVWGRGLEARWTSRKPRKMSRGIVVSVEIFHVTFPHLYRLLPATLSPDWYRKKCFHHYSSRVWWWSERINRQTLIPPRFWSLDPAASLLFLTHTSTRVGSHPAPHLPSPYGSPEGNLTFHCLGLQAGHIQFSTGRLSHADQSVYARGRDAFNDSVCLAHWCPCATVCNCIVVHQGHVFFDIVWG